MMFLSFHCKAQRSFYSLATQSCILYVVVVLDPPRLPLVISSCLVDLWRFFRLKIIVLYGVSYGKFKLLFSSITFCLIYNLGYFTVI